MAKRIMLSSRIDEQVLFTFLGVGILSLIVFGFRYISRPNCMPISIQVSGAVNAGRTVRFKAETALGTNFSWNFGDGEKAEDQVPSTIHIYKQPGKYIVSVLVNKTCDESLEIMVLPGTTDAAIAALPEIETSKDTVSIHEEVMISDASLNSTSWVWNLGEPGSPEQYTRTVKFAYSTPGIKKIVLTVNGKTVSNHSIFVREKELPGLPTGPAAPKAARKRPVVNNISDTPVGKPLFIPGPVKAEEPPPPVVVKIADPPTGFLVAVVKGIPNGGEWREALSKYLCADGMNTRVVYNGVNTTLGQICEALSKVGKSDARKITDVAVTPIFNKATNCISLFTIKIDETSGLPLFKKTRPFFPKGFQ